MLVSVFIRPQIVRETGCRDLGGVSGASPRNVPPRAAGGQRGRRLDPRTVLLVIAATNLLTALACPLYTAEVLSSDRSLR